MESLRCQQEGALPILTTRWGHAGFGSQQAGPITSRLASNRTSEMGGGDGQKFLFPRRTAAHLVQNDFYLDGAECPLFKTKTYPCKTIQGTTQTDYLTKQLAPSELLTHCLQSCILFIDTFLDIKSPSFWFACEENVGQNRCIALHVSVQVLRQTLLEDTQKDPLTVQHPDM